MIGRYPAPSRRKRIVGPRVDIWTDAAARKGGKQYPIAKNISSSAGFALMRILQAEGWYARAVPHGSDTGAAHDTEALG